MVSTKWLEPRRSLQSGDLVLVVSEDTARNSWPLGLVVETFPSRDGLVRSRVKCIWRTCDQSMSFGS